MKSKFVFSLAILLCLGIIPLKLDAQRNHPVNLQFLDQKPYHFGFILSVNQMNFSLKTNDSKIVPNPEKIPTDTLVLGQITKPGFGFTVGLSSELKLNPLLDLRFVPSLAFGERSINNELFSTSKFNTELRLSSAHIDLPLYVKFKSKRYYNYRAYILSGIKYTYTLSSKLKENHDDFSNFIKKSDLFFEAGCGFDFYLPYFKFGVELKMSYGLFNLIQSRENIYSNAISSLHSKLFQISFTFE